MLYPQASVVTTADFNPPRLTDAFNTNPRGCWIGGATPMTAGT
ncbi:hypothetical protein ACFQU2_02515 [Siccirubricoccus deserti]